MSQISDCLDLLRQLVAIPSESQNEEAHARFLADYLKDELEMETQLQHVEGKSYNVTGCWHPIKGKARRKLMLGGHLDTVSPTDLWETDPYRLVQQGDQLHGLGAGDMKGGLAAQLMVLKSLKEQGGLWDAEVEFVGLADEECHSVGANAYVRRVQEEKQPQPETFFIMAEPHFDNIVVGATGKVLLKLEVTGAPGHAAMPEKGINAVDCMAALLQAVNQTWGSCYREGRVGSHCCLMIHSDYPGYSLNIADILSLCAWNGSPDMVYEFASTSKITIPGAGMAVMAASQANIQYLSGLMDAQIISCDKINQLRQVRFLKDKAHTLELMQRHAALLRPRFDAFLTELEKLRPLEIARWTQPQGGYFISLYTLPGCAKRTVEL